MFAKALEIAKEHNGIIIGSCAISRLVPRLTYETIDIATRNDAGDGSVLSCMIECRVPFYRELLLCGGQIRLLYFLMDGMSDFENTVMSSMDLDICKCYYDSDGVFHATDAARVAANTRTMSPIEKVHLHRVHKYRRLGFLITDCTYTDRTVYLPELHNQILDMPEIINIVIKDMHVTDALIRELSAGRPNRTYKLINAFVDAVSAPICSAYNSMFLGTRITCDTEMTECAGHVTCDEYGEFETNPFLLVETQSDLDEIHTYETCTISHDSDGMVNGVESPFSEECDERAKLYVEFLAGLDAVTDKQMELAETLEAVHLMTKANIVLCAKNRKWANMYFGRYSYRNLDIIPSGVRVPIEHIHCMLGLLEFTMRDLTCVKHKYYTNYVKTINFADLSEYIGPRMYMNSIPTFIVADWPSRIHMLEGAVLQPYRIVCKQYDRYTVLNLDVDGIMDMLDTEGYTANIVEFLEMQLEIDWMHDGALERALRARDDVPKGLLRNH